MELHKKIKEKKIKTDWRQVLAMGVLCGGFVGFLLVAGIFLVVREKYMRIQSVVVSGGVRISNQRLEFLTNELLDEQCFIHASCRYNIWYSLADIPENLKKIFPTLHSVTTLYDKGILYVKVSERTPAFIWCFDSKKQECYFMDESGVLFEHAPRMSGYIGYSIAYPDSSMLTVNFPKNQLPTRVWQSIETRGLLETVKNLKQFGNPISFSYTKRDIHVVMAKLYGLPVRSAKLLLNRDLVKDSEYRDALVRALSKFETYEPFFSRFNVYPDSFQYLDLRFPGRVYMKFQ